MIWLLSLLIFAALSAAFWLARRADLGSTLEAHAAGLREGNRRADADGDDRIDESEYRTRTVLWQVTALAVFAAGILISLGSDALAALPLHAVWIALLAAKSVLAFRAARNNRRAIALRRAYES